MCIVSATDWDMASIRGRKIVEKWHAYYACPTRYGREMADETISDNINRRLLRWPLINTWYVGPVCFVWSELVQFVLEVNAR